MGGVNLIENDQEYERNIRKQAQKIKYVWE